MFCSSIIQSAREGSDIVGLFYQNDVESMHYVEKLKQSFQKLSLLEVINCLQKILTRQEEEEIRAIHGASTYTFLLIPTNSLVLIAHVGILGQEKEGKIMFLHYKCLNHL